jgi:hypothetical protein
MAARTCLMCGKPLSRIWAGAGEDFCSREHRTQYRLRRGMDRLHEANKLANAMRRRESARPLPENRPQAGPDKPRGFLDPKKRNLRPEGLPAVRVANPVSLGTNTGMRVARAVAGRLLDGRTAAIQPAFPGGSLLVPRRETTMAAQVMQAPAAAIARPLASEIVHCDAAIRWRGEEGRIVAGVFAKSEQRGSWRLFAEQPPRRITSLSQGRALRVSMTAGFRLPQRRSPGLPDFTPQTGMLAWPEWKPIDARGSQMDSEARLEKIETTIPAMRVPPSPPADFKGRFEWPGQRDIRIKFRDAGNGRRAASVPFAPPDEFNAKERR